MATFTYFEGTTYTRKDNGYCFVEQGGKKTRISKAEFEEAERIHKTYHASEEDLEKLVAETEEANLTEEIEGIAKEMEEIEEGNRVVLEPANLNEYGMVECGGCSYSEHCEHSGAFRRNPVEKGGLGLCPRLSLGHTEEPEIKKPHVFKVGDTTTRSGLHGGNFTYKVTSRTKSVIRVVESWIAEDSGELCKEKRTLTIDIDPETGDERIVMWAYGEDVGYWYSENEAEVKVNVKKSRAAKNAAFKTTHNDVEVTLTEKQVDFIKHLPDTCFWENGPDSCIWVDCLCDEIGGQFKGKPMTVGAMVSTLCEKNLGSRGTDRREGRKCTCFSLTELGKVVAAELGLN